MWNAVIGGGVFQTVWDWILVGGISLLVGLLFLALGRSFGGDYRQLKNATARRCADLGVADVGRVCEVQGVTAAGPEGTVRGPYSGVEGVWTVTEVKRCWTDLGLEGDTTARKTVVKPGEGQPFYVADESGRVAVIDVNPFDVRGFPATVRSKDKTGPPPGFELLGKDDEHFVYEEWVLPAGVPMWVSGAVKRHGAGLAIGEPDGRGGVLLNAAPADESAGEARGTARFFYAIGGLGVLLGAVLIAVGLV